MRAAPTRHARLERDAIADVESGDGLAGLDNLAGALVTQNDRSLDDVVADPPVFVVVNVRPADADVLHADQNLVRGGLRALSLLDLEPPDVREHC